MHIFHRHALPRRTSGGALLVFGSVALAAALAACNPKEPSDPIGNADAVASITVIPPDTITVGDTVDFGYDVEDASGNDVSDPRGYDLEWSSSDTNVATIDGGTLAAKAPGTTTITATADGVQGQATVEIQGPPPPP